MGDRTAFFYGTLMAPGVLHRVIYGTHSPEQWQLDLTTVRPAVLHSYRRHRVRHADYPAIIPCSGSVVQGTYVTGLTEGDIRRLDIFEGDMYDRTPVEVLVLKDGGAKLNERIDLDALKQSGEAADSEMITTQTYVWGVDVADLEEEEWDFEQFKKDKMKAWMGLQEDETTAVDEGFADVDRAVAEEERLAEEEKNRTQNTEDGSSLKADPSGGRINGKIARDLALAGS